MLLVNLPSVLRAALLVASLAFVAACAKDNPPVSTPTTEPPTAIAGPTVTPSPAPTPFGVRTDCPPAWTYYNDPMDRFSFCYPADLKLVTTSPAGERSLLVGVYPLPARPGGQYMVTFGALPTFGDICTPGNSGGGYLHSVSGTRVIAGASLPTCTTDYFEDMDQNKHTARMMTARVPSSHGTIDARVYSQGVPLTDSEALGFAILDTLVVR